jgi:hypothetical protein
VKYRLSGRKGGSTYSQRKVDLLIFGAKIVLYLWRTDPSFRNSVTGSGSRAKCSNILQDTTHKTFLGQFSPISVLIIEMVV